MDFGAILKNECVNVPLPPDERCNDPAFAFANPTLCPAVPKLILAPGNAIVCLLGSIQYRAFYVANGVETDVTKDTVFTVNDPTICVIGASSGNATGITGIEGGDVIITASYKGFTATSDLTVIGTPDTCCSQESVAFMVMVDNTKSMSQAFGGSFSTKLTFAKAAAQQFISEINETKDLVGLMTFNEFDSPIIDAPTSNKVLVSTHAGQITQSQQSTTFFDPIQTAIAALQSVTADRRVLVIISDGQDETSDDYATNNPVSLAETFKQSNGSIISLGVRATGNGFSLLNLLSTSGFFVNSYSSVQAEALTILSGIKGYMCGGNCVPEGDEFVATGSLNYLTWTNWTGQADLLGNGFIDLLPGNGLYVDLSSATAPFNATLTSRDSFAVTAGKNYRLTMNLAGNQRVDLPSNVTVKIQSASVVYVNQTLSITDYTADFSQHAFTFTPQVDDDVTIIISGGASTTLSVAGPLIDSIVFDNTTDLVNLLTDDFSNENVRYIPPRCGTGSTPIYTGTGGGGGGVFDTEFGGFYMFGATTASYSLGPMAPSKLFVFVCMAESGPITVSDTANNTYTALPLRSAPTTNHVLQVFYCINPTLGALTFTANGTNIVGHVYIFNCSGNPVLLAETFNGSDDFQTIQAGAITPSDPAVFIAAISMQPGGNVLIDGSGTDRMYAESGPSSGVSKIFYSEITLDPEWECDADSQGVASLIAFGTAVDPGYGFATGYSCYGTGCLNTNPPPAQLQDPNPLPDIEAGFTPPQQFKSTKTACVVCPAGFVNVSNADLVPAMTSDTAPSGIVSSSAGFNGNPAWTMFDHNPATGWISLAAPTAWAQYQFAAAQVITEYALTVPNSLSPVFNPNGNINESSPSDWIFQGSNDGATWTDLDTQTGISWFVGERKLFTIPNTTAYLYYRVLMTNNTYVTGLFPGTVNFVFILTEIEMYGAVSAQACASASATSSASQSDADTQAIAAATVLANAMLNCQKLYTSTQSFTAHCPAGQLGSAITKSASATSFISQDDADTKALAAAQALANAALTCDGDNHNQAITINDNAAATPYPSVRRITGLTGHITKVVVTVKNFSHESPSDVQIVLQSPSGTYVQLMLGCGGPLGSNPVTNLTFVFDDTGSVMPASGVLVSGTFAPSIHGVTPNLPAPAAVPPYGVLLADFIGEVPNGSWALWITDKFPISTGSVAGVPAFDLTITTA